MTQNGSTAILMIQKFVHEQMDNSSKWVYGEVANIFGEYEEGKGGTK